MDLFNWIRCFIRRFLLGLSYFKQGFNGGTFDYGYLEDDLCIGLARMEQTLKGCIVHENDSHTKEIKQLRLAQKLLKYDSYRSVDKVYKKWDISHYSELVEGRTDLYYYKTKTNAKNPDEQEQCDLELKASFEFMDKHNQARKDLAYRIISKYSRRWWC